MITLFCNEEQKKEEEFFGSFLVSLFSLFSLSFGRKCVFVLLLFLRGTSFYALFVPFSLSFILFGNHLIRITALYFLSSLVFIHYTLYINTHTRTL